MAIVTAIVAVVSTVVGAVSGAKKKEAESDKARSDYRAYRMQSAIDDLAAKEASIIRANDSVLYAVAAILILAVVYAISIKNKSNVSKQ